MAAAFDLEAVGSNSRVRKQEAEERYQAITLKHGLVIYGALNGPHRYPAFRRGLPT